MIKARRLVYEFKTKFNRFNGKDKPDLPVVDIMSTLNEAVGVYFESLVEMAEVDSYYRDALRCLEVKNHNLKENKKSKTASESVFTIPDDSYRVIRAQVYAKTKNCPQKKMRAIKVQSDDLEALRCDEFWKSSYEWEQILYDESKEGFHFFHEGQMDVAKVDIDYYLRPSEIHAPSMAKDGEYIDWCGEKRTIDCDLELDKVFDNRKIVDIAIVLARQNLEEFQGSQAKINEIIFKNRRNGI